MSFRRRAKGEASPFVGTERPLDVRPLLEVRSASGPSLPICDVRCLVANGVKAEVPVTLRNDVIDPLPPSAIQSSCVAVFLFDQLVRAQQDRCRHIEAKRLGGLHIEHVFGTQLGGDFFSHSLKS